MKTSLLKSQIKNWWLVFAILLAIFGFLFITKKNWQYLVFALLSASFLHFKIKGWFLACLFLVSLIMIYDLQRPDNLENQVINGVFKIKKLNYRGFVITYQNNDILVDSHLKKIQINDLVQIKGTIQLIDFDNKAYFETQKIINYLPHGEIELKSQSQDLRNLLIDFIDRGEPIYTNYTLLILLGIKNQDNYFLYNKLIELNVVHLFVISGFHLNLLFWILEKIFTKLRCPTKMASFFALFINGFYLYFLNFPLASMRAFCLIIGKKLNEFYYCNRLDNLVILAIIFLGFALINPYQITSLSFILTFLISFVIGFFSLITFHARYQKIICFYGLIYLVSLPISLVMNNYWAVFGFFFSLIITPFFTIIYFLTLLFFPFQPLMNKIYQGFDLLLNSLTMINYLMPISWLNWKIIQTFYLIIYGCFIMSIQWKYFMAKKGIWLI